MHFRKRTLLALLAAAIGLSAATLAVAAPDAAACALVATRAFSSLSDGSQVEPASSAQDPAAYLSLLSGARARIGTTFDAPRATPLVVFFQDPQLFWPLKVNVYGSTSFVGSRTCVLVGPEGHNLDVVAHELMHAELAERVGYWQRLTDIPTWFDEGVAMQVDLRSKFDVPQRPAIDTSYVRQLTSNWRFSDPDGELLTRNYASAKAEVAHLRDGMGAHEFLQRLDRMRKGERFAAVFAR